MRARWPISLWIVMKRMVWACVDFAAATKNFAALSPKRALLDGGVN
jgi:hypothetical protein